VIHTDTPKELAKEWNVKRDNAFNEILFDELWARFETPIARNRWDSPLFVIALGMPLPFDDVYITLFERKAANPNSATAPQILTETNYVHEFDKITQDIISKILEAQNTGLPGDAITLPKTDKKFVLSKKVGLQELRKWKRQFLKISQLHPPPVNEIADAFAEYLTTNI